MKRPNALPPDRMRPLERRAELCRLLALGLVRLRMGDRARCSSASGDGSLDCAPGRSGHATERPEEVA